jgi:NDP-sugar pyrophosphorylase family protein
MKALLLAAGEGTRLRPLTLDRPKPMLPLAGCPMLDYLVRHVRRHGIRDVAINLHYKPHVIVDHFGDGRAHDVAITYSHEQRLLGSAGAAKALDWFFDGTFLILYGDVLTDIDLGALVARHREYGAVATLALYEVDDPSRCGIVELDSAGYVTRFSEKPAPGTVAGNLANAGVYVLEPSVLRYVPAGRTSDFGQDVFPRLLELGLPIAGIPADGYVLDIGSPERYAQAEHDVLAGRVWRERMANHALVDVARR